MRLQDHIEKDCSDDEMLLVTQIKQNENGALDCLWIKYLRLIEKMIKNFGFKESEASDLKNSIKAQFETLIIMYDSKRLPLKIWIEQNIENICVISVLEKAVHNSERAWEIIFKNYSRYIWTIIKKIHQKLSNEDQKDISQDIIIKIYKNISKYEPEKAFFRKWIIVIAFNTCLDVRRKIKRNKVDNFDEENEHENSKLLHDIKSNVEDKIDLGIIWSEISKLPEDEKTVMISFYWFGLSYKEIANLFGKDEKWVSNKLTKAKKKIKNILNLGS